jgi:hypothetical protein
MTTATSTSTLGVIIWTVAVTIFVGWMATVAADWRKLKGKKVAAPFREALRGNVFWGICLVGALVAVVMFSWGVFVVRTIYADHQFFVATNDRQARQIYANRHLLDVAGVFTEYRLMIENNFSETRCLIEVTAPPEAQEMANTVRDMAGMGARCSLSGPGDTTSSPERAKHTEIGMIDGGIVFHARKGKDEDAVFDVLKTLLPLKRTYEVPPGSPDHFIWLQFGRDVKWKN